MSRVESEHNVSRRKFIKLGFLAASGAWTGWSYLHQPPQTDLRKQLKEADSRWNNAAEKLKQTGGVLDKGGFLRSPQFDPNNPATTEYYKAKNDINELSGKIIDDEYPLVQVQSYGQTIGVITTFVSVVAVLNHEGPPVDEPEQKAVTETPLPNIF